MYYVGNIPVMETDIQHFGVPGMKWGIRKYQNPDGTLNSAGKLRYQKDMQKRDAYTEKLRKLEPKHSALKEKSARANNRAYKDHHGVGHFFFGGPGSPIYTEKRANRHADQAERAQYKADRTDKKYYKYKKLIAKLENKWANVKLSDI